MFISLSQSLPCQYPITASFQPALQDNLNEQQIATDWTNLVDWAVCTTLGREKLKTFQHNQKNVVNEKKYYFLTIWTPRGFSFTNTSLKWLVQVLMKYLESVVLMVMVICSLNIKVSNTNPRTRLVHWSRLCDLRLAVKIRKTAKIQLP